MQSIAPTIKPTDSGAQVANLIACLLLLIERRILRTFAAPSRPTPEELKQLAAEAQLDLAQQFFGEAVQRLVWDFQIQQGLGDDLNGVVEQKTAARMNQVLLSLGVELTPLDYEVFGLVIDASGRRIASVNIHAFDRDVQRESVLGRAVTDGAGAYRIVFPASLYRMTEAERGGPDLLVRAFDAMGLLLAQSALVPGAGARTELNLNLDSDLRLVSGTVRDDQGRPLPGMRVQAFDRDLRSEELLGEALTNASGRYQIRYTPEQFRRAEKAAADLRLRVFDADGERELMASQTLFNAPQRATIDLAIPVTVLHTESEWERYLRELGPLLQTLAPHELNDDDLRFLAGETGIDAEHLNMVRRDALWRHQQAQYKLPPAALYGLLRQGVADDWTRLLQAGPALWRAALKQAIAARQAPAVLAQLGEQFVSELTELAIDQAFEAPPDGSTDEPRIGVLLAGSALKLDVQRLIAGVFLQRLPDDDPRQLWQSLAHAGVPDEAVRSTRFALEAHGLVHQHLPTLATLQASLARGFGAGADLARLARPQWLEVAQAVAKSLPKDFDSAEAYAESLADRVELAYPTAVVAHRLVEDAHPLRSDVGQLLNLNPEFDLLTGAVGQFMATAKLGDIKSPREALAKQLGTEARVGRIAPASNRAKHMQTLQAEGFDSAAKVVMAGGVAFKNRIGMIAGLAAADEMYRNAQLRAADLTLRALALRDHVEWPIAVMPRADVAPDSGLADWVEMFGSANGCFCPPCESVHGPGAYLVDLFQYLKEMKARYSDDTAHAASLFEKLDERRPDLKYLNLNCANAETPLPYIDLVNELLERQIVPVPASAASTPQTPETIAGTKDVAARLRALPIDNPAFDALYATGGAMQTPLYPWNLPFDRDFHQSGICFGLIGVVPAEVLALEVAPGIDLARAHLGLSPATWNLLHNTRLADVAASWGLTSLDSLLYFGHEAGLLARSGRPVAELFSLIESPLFDGWSLYIDRKPLPTDDPCNIDRTQLRQQPGGPGTPIENLDSETQLAVCDLLHRILRLRLALDWPLAKLQVVLQALRVSREQSALNLVALGRLVALAAQLGLSAEQLAARMLALDQATEDADMVFARAAWLASMRITDADYRHLCALRLADALVAPDPAGRLLQLEEALCSMTLLRAAGADPAELHYLLHDADLVPAVFTPSGEHLQSQLSELVDAIRDAGDAAPAAVLRIVVERLVQATGAGFVAAVIADAEPAEPALLGATGAGMAGGALQDFIVLAADPAHDTSVAHRLRLEAAGATLRRILKTCRLLTLLRFTQTDVGALCRLKGRGIGLFDFDALPVVGGTTVLGLEQLLPLVQASVTQASMPASDQRLLHMIAHAASAEAAYMDFEAMTGAGRAISTASNSWEALPALAQALGLAAMDAATWQAPKTYARLLAASGWLSQRRLTFAPENALAILRAGAVGAPGALAPLRVLARSRHASDSEWYKAMTPAMDRLRIRQRDALLAHLLHTTPRWKTADDVYAELLIDVQMGACQLSSRLVQAHAAVHLFVQRCLMNLEPADQIALGDVSDVGQWRQWEWMKNYRVWEAGRKVFLYPENWIEPDLRVVKSPVFEDLENELLQGEITPDAVEQAVRAYLGKLHDVARLDIRALYQEHYDERRGDGTTIARTIIHMVGRTHGEPHTYHYRRRLADLTWTPWEQLDFSIDADHLLLVVQDRRPMLFWPEWHEVQASSTSVEVIAPTSPTAAEPATTWDMRLCWTMHEFGAWAAPRKSVAAQPAQPRFRINDRSGVLLQPREAQDRIAILVYDTRGAARAGALDSFFMLDPCTGELTLHSDTDVFTELSLPLALRARNQLLEESASGASAAYLDRLASGAGVTGSIAVFTGEFERFTVVPSHQFEGFSIGQPYVFTYAGRPLHALLMATSPDTFPRFMLEAGDHPYACDMLEAVRSDGLPGLYRPAERRVSAPSSPGGFEIDVQKGRHPRQRTVDADNWVVNQWHPNSYVVANNYLGDAFDFSVEGAYSLYNWEIFFHIPLLLADRLSKNGAFAEAQQWFHTMFDPTDVSPHPAPQKYWRVKPLFGTAALWGSGAIETLEAMMRRLAAGNDALNDQVAAWRNDPFNPHLIASVRLAAYMKTVVQKYIENLTAWADSLFRRDTMESINEATQLYVLGNDILGAAPTVLPPMRRAARSYDDLARSGTLDDFSNAIEASVPLAPGTVGATSRTAASIAMLYFCIPANPRIEELRATIADRLFKIRHCMDIEGRARQLALFAPPIDPALLVRARAAGLDIGTALGMALGTRPSHYRFQPLLQKALEFCGEVRSFGGALLSALEKRDGEQLAQLRARHEVGILKMVSLIKRQQVSEAEANLDVIDKSRVAAQARHDFYSSREFMSPGEIGQVANLSIAQGFETAAQTFNVIASLAYLVPDVKIGLTDPGATTGGTSIGNAVKATGGVLGLIASEFNFAANMSAIMAGHQRRADEWALQTSLASAELAQIEQQAAAAQIRLAIAEQEQRNHERQILQAEEMQAALRDKFTNTQLYSWMSAQLAALHYQSYRMAFDLAKQAEAAAGRELPMRDGYIQSDHWDGGRKGLLAGERLAQDLRRLELAYMQGNTRLLEITSNVSLRRLDPIALWRLRSDAACAFSLPASLFDADFPEHSGRRIKSVSVSVPGVVGPYGGVNGILSCGSGTELRRIATSSGQNDAGVFQLDFRDERYLPFEGVDLDADTAWTFVLPAQRQFDYDTISDLVLHIQYTVRELGAVRELPPAAPPAQRLLISVRHDFPAESRLLREGHAPDGVAVVLAERLFPYLARGEIHINNIIRLTGSAPPPPVSGNNLRLGAADADAYFAIEYA